MATRPSPIRSRSVLLAAAGIALAAALVLWTNFDMPLVRNGVTYARTTQAIVDSGFNPLPVIADSSKLFGRPIGFPLVASPFAHWMGVNRGLKAASFVTTLLFLFVSCLFLARMRRRLGLESSIDWVDLVLLSFNPLVVYQFWSAHPDALFSTTFLLSILLADRLADASGPKQLLLAGALAAAMYASIELKYYGAILLVAVPAYCAVRSKGPVSRLALPGLAALVPLLLVAAGLAGVNPTLNLGTVSGLRRYEMAFSDSGTLGLYVTGSVAQIAVFLLVVFSVTFIYFFRRPKLTRPVLALALVVALFVAGLLPFRGTGYNMRYFLPILPILILVVREGMRASTGRAARLVLPVFMLLQAVPVLNYNTRFVYEVLSPINVAAESLRYPGTRRVMSVFDSLRMGHHVAAQEVVEFIDRDLPPGGTLYLVTDYYGEAAHGFYEELGLIRRHDVDVRYVPTLRKLRQERREPPFYVCARCEEVLLAKSVDEVSRRLGREVRPVGRVFRVE